MGITDHLSCLLRKLYAGQEASVRTRHGTMDWFQIGKGVCQGCILSPCLTSMESISYKMPGWMSYKLGSRLLGRNINNLRYADDTTLKVESQEELKNLLMRVKEDSEKAGLKLKLQRTNIMTSGHIISWQIDGETMETVTAYFLGLQHHCRL